MRLVEIQHVSRSYGHVQALKDVSLSLAPGTIGLVGNNGAGKSTLLKILLGLLAPDQGGGTILGFDVRTSGNELRGCVGYMPESAATVPVLKGVEFVTLSGDLYGMPHRDARRRAHEVLDYVGLGELRYRRLEEYSSGNIQRLKLAAALVHDPKLLLLDEPTNGLDPSGRIAMLRLIEDLIAETEKSVILCTHLLGDVEQLCEQVVVLHQGTVISCGSMEELKQQTGNRFEISWQGADEGFLAALGDRGAELQLTDTPHQARVDVPNGWSTTVFFEIAAAHDVVLTQLTPEEENLEKLFFRVTDEASISQQATPEKVSEEPSHGN